MAEKLPLDFAFRAKYKVESVMPEDLEFANFPIFAFNETGAYEYDAKVSTSLIIRPDNGETWAVGLDGDFATFEQANGVFACPNPNCFLAVIDAVAYYIDSTTPGAATGLNLCPVSKVERCPKFDLVLVTSFTHLTCIGTEGIIWTSGQVVRDGLVVERISDTEIFGHGDAFELGLENYFSVSALDGSVIRGNMFCKE
ncbi:MAG: hypothetical protein JSS86_22595 [Cyanobacteria bacterium SZAS LIN-2]|nr:hypothetical protein [Cyanobacteria bacterium SZAS LIN-2]